MFCIAEGWRDNLVKSILNDEVVVISKDRYKELVAKNEQMTFDNRQILKLAILITILLALLYFIIHRFLLTEKIGTGELSKFLKEKKAEGFSS